MVSLLGSHDALADFYYKTATGDKKNHRMELLLEFPVKL